MGLVLVKDPNVSVSTPWAYRECRSIRGSSYLEGEVAFEQRRQALRTANWLHPLRSDSPPPLHNDLQPVVAPQTSSVRIALALLEALPGQLSVAMSGSGPSCFALFPDRQAADSALASHRSSFEKAGLASWSCSLQSVGVNLAI